MRRWRLLIAVVIFLPCLAVFLGTRISSPAQQEASARPPIPSVITAEVVQKVVGETIVVNGDASTSQTVDVAATSAANTSPIVSDVRTHAGDEVKEGQVLVVVSGRPVIALFGAVPAYRDLQPGMSGADVSQLQKALRRIGYSRGGDAEGKFGRGTQVAIAKLYQDKGFSSVNTSADADDVLQQAKQEVDDAQQRLNRALHSDPPTEASSLDESRNALKAAQRKYQTLSDTTGVTAPQSELVFVSGFPAHVTQSRAKLGAKAVDEKDSKPLMSIGAGQVSVKTFIDPDQKNLVRAGGEAVIQTPDGRDVIGSIDSVGDELEQVPDGSSGYSIAVSAGDQLSTELVGKSLQVTIKAAATSGPVLAVPSSAVYSSADGSTRVTKTSAIDGEDVNVVVGATGGGWVEIKSSQASLVVGDSVIVGVNGKPEQSGS